jgi:hypothetical protein
VSRRVDAFLRLMSSSGRSVGFSMELWYVFCSGYIVWVVVHGQHVRPRISVAKESAICRPLAQLMRWKNGAERPWMQPVSNSNRYIDSAVHVGWSSMLCHKVIGLYRSHFSVHFAIRY